MARGTYAIITWASPDLDATFACLRASGCEVAQELTDQPNGVRDCAFRDPASFLIRITTSSRPRSVGTEAVLEFQYP